MQQIVDSIESRLSHQFCLEELSTLVRLSPSHCGTKFPNTEGLSLCRFVNRRRLAKALVVLRNDATPLSQVALDLGFSSQSHFTRLFGELTGMPPAKYRKQFGRPVG
jgi:AraC family transcriptional regulator